MGQGTAAAVLDAILCITGIAAAALSQRIKRTITEQTVKCLRITAPVAGKGTAGPVLEK